MELRNRRSKTSDGREFDEREARFELCEKSQLRFFRSGTGIPVHRLLSDAPCFDRLEITPQLSAVLSDLVASFATIKWREQRVCKLAPGDPQQFLQSVYGAEQIVWRCHPGRFRNRRRQRFVKDKPDSHDRRNAGAVPDPAVASGFFVKGATANRVAHGRAATT